MSDDPDVLSVTQLTREIREVLEGHIGSVWVEGEISNHRLQSSGHQYFTLKDAGAQLSCVMFRGAAARNSARVQDGALMQVHGEISVYEPRGQYQMVVKQVQAKGKGSLQERFEALKRKLYDEGLFDEANKRPIPRFPCVVALVTSPTGAAIQDMLNILTRRAPWVRVLVFPVRVQGQGAEREIVHALEVLGDAEAHGLPAPDTIVVGRGGGSLEDLWCFNEEVLARAIAACPIPVISAVGHEIDFTIADFVADLRAPTPSAAAELLAPDSAELQRHFDSIARTLKARVGTLLEHHQHVIELTSKGPLRHAPERLLQQAEQNIDEHEAHLRESLREQLQSWTDDLMRKQQVLAAHHPRVQLSEAVHRTETCAHRLQQGLIHRLDRLSDRLNSRGELLKHIGPGAVLARGFSFTTNADGRVLKDADEVKEGDELITRLAQGSVRSVAKA
ncbi:exodeoxyribonuclease VII large subunit [Prosthecobacter sp.]|uniref:exodeoxyribonuclease VII large subunit n=1 Tax=Prosthecobacter sp. TaxID=1965333 RepID=UPI001E18FA33|nr:exodeoxyribonuclease VII large subunit [Prosthecobacter sp.]MCB1276433.1 exodeoxyribonuclease VII large subunit [Prosthecobacter sp.]